LITDKTFQGQTLVLPKLSVTEKKNVMPFVLQFLLIFAIAAAGYVWFKG
jgi:hypothetical protein